MVRATAGVTAAVAALERAKAIKKETSNDLEELNQEINELMAKMAMRKSGPICVCYIHLDGLSTPLRPMCTCRTCT